MKNLYRKAALLVLICTLNLSRILACGGDYDWDEVYYYNLFSQEIIEDLQYKPFLISNVYSHTDKSMIRNENIEEWQEYFGISYEDTRYLVFDADKSDIQSLLKGAKVNDPKLHFIHRPFVKRYKQALEYIVYAKELEPYMHIIVEEDSWWYRPSATVADLDYEEVMSRLKTGWKKTKDKELKLRYGYQLVRFAHYYRKYEEAIELFNTYVESLNFRPAMYYHALSQKAGAERGNGDVAEANYHFLRVFVNSKNLKGTAVSSIQLNGSADWADLVEKAQNQKELNDAYLLLGYNSFNNPLNEVRKIVENDPDAIQAKILMANAINQIERNDMSKYYTNQWTRNQRKSEGTFIDKRYPVTFTLTDQIIELSDDMTKNAAAKDKNFWFMTSAYLHFLNKDFDTARQYLSQVDEENEKYILQKINLSFFIDISEPTYITPELEIRWYEKYRELLARNKSISGEEDYQTSTIGFAREIWANRYYLQKDYAKSFLLTHSISSLERNPRLDLLDMLDEFYQKQDKNPMEEYIARSFSSIYSGGYYSRGKNYLDYLRGIICLTQGDFSGAHTAFQQTDPGDIKVSIEDYIFATNIRECMSCDQDWIMIKDYISDFPFIPETMSYEELSAILMKLDEIGKKNTRLSSKANYLLGNFFFNTSPEGYYRHILRFGTGNYYRYWTYEIPKKKDLYDEIFNDIYFKDYPTYYENTYTQAETYLKLAHKQASDNELKAHIIFALAKCEQQEFNEAWRDHRYRDEKKPVLEEKYFKELLKLHTTAYFDEVQSRCKYFEYYLYHSGEYP